MIRSGFVCLTLLVQNRGDVFGRDHKSLFGLPVINGVSQKPILVENGNMAGCIFTYFDWSTS